MEGTPATKELVINDAEENTLQRVRQYSVVQGKAPSFRHAYNREAAIAYAAQWSFERNPRLPAYDEKGGNCTNFTSQCLLAGGIPMDYKGRSQ